MNVIDIHRTVKLSLPITDQEYTGSADNCNFRHWKGKQKWKKQELHQQYTGEFLHDCIHGYGTYSWQNIDTRHRNVCEGKFYANNIEGYACISYQDGRVFEGLFKENRRFGPGVLTYANGSQDVGLWEGKSLVRLNQRPNNTVPFIAESVQGKAYLLKFKNLVPVQEKDKSVAYQLLSKSSTNEEILEKSDLLHSKFVKNTNSVFFNKTLFNDNFFQNEEDWTIDVIECFPQCDTPIITKVLVTHLLAWNNEKLYVEFMKHAFRHRNQEHILTYNVSNVSTGQRNLFRVPGLQENIALQFLHYCSENKAQIISRLITNNDLYVDICDCYGNNGILYAATYDQTSVLQTLTNYGANVDHMNDECLTALIVTILRYTALKYDITNWENAFLPAVSVDDISPETQEWRNHYFITSSDTNFNYKQEYFYDLSCVRPTSKRGKRKKPIKETKKKTVKESVEEYHFRKSIMLQIMIETVMCLLKCGAKPDYGLCPFPPLILSVFSRSPDIVYTLLTYGANPNIRTSYHLGSLTPLHIIASLSPSLELIAMAGYLMTGGADSSIRANTTHWVEETTVLIAKYPVNADEGKTPLHLLCMRYDFQEDTNDYLGELCSLMLILGADPNMEYIGHNALTLAILRGNLNMISHVLDSGIVDPNQTLSNNMGVPLTVLILKRYELILSATTCQNVFNRLMEYYANPLNTVLGFDCNAMEFAYDENLPKEEKPGKSSKSNKSAKSGKSTKPIKLKGNDIIIEVLRYAAEATAIKRIQKRVVEYLYQFKFECGFQDPVWDAIVKYIDVPRCVTLLQLLVDYDIIFPCRTFMVELLKYVSESVTKKKSNKLKEKPSGPNFFDNMVDNIDFEKTEFREKVFSFNIFMPELDPDESKFKVCFECFQKRNKVLMLCPKCHLVYFCSQACNIKNNKRKDTKHPCKILFYNSELQKMKECLEKGFSSCEPMDIFGEYGRLRQILIDSNPDYFERIKNLDIQREMEKGKLSKTSTNKLFMGKTKTISSKSERSAKSSRSRSQEYAEESDKKEKSTKKSKKSKSPTKSKIQESTKGKEKSQIPKSDKLRSLSPETKEKIGADKDKKERADKDKKEETKFDGVTDELRQSVLDVCEKFDYKFFQMFMPFCICVDSQLYYKFDNLRKYYKLASFSHI